MISTDVPPIVETLSEPTPAKLFVIEIAPLGTTFAPATTPPTVTLPPVVFTVTSVPPSTVTLPEPVVFNTAAFPVNTSD